MATSDQGAASENEKLDLATPQYHAPPTVSYNPAALQPVTVNQLMRVEPKNFLTDYRAFCITITVVFGILGPQSLITGIPAIIFAFKGFKYMKEGSYQQSRSQSLAGVYLSFGTIFISVIISSLLIFFLLFFRYDYSRPDF